MHLIGKNNLISLRIVGIIFLLFSGCAGLPNNLYTEIKPEFKDREIKKIGIMKFENKSLDPEAGLKTANVFYNELASYHRFEIIAPAEMAQKGYGMEFVKELGSTKLSPSPEKVDEPKVRMTQRNEEDIEKRIEIDAVITGIITRYNDKDGSSIAVNKPASVAFQVYLISVEDNKILWSANFAETQEALLDNLLLAGRYAQAGGVWLTSDALTKLGIEKVIKNFPGLIPEKLK